VKIRNNLSVGAGFDYIHSTIELHQRGDLSAVAVAPGVTFGQLGIPAYTDFFDAVLKASGNGVGFHFGVQWRATDRLSSAGAGSRGARSSTTGRQTSRRSRPA